jgi:hypothetical protein
MLVRDVTFSGLSLMGHQTALAEIISANGCRSVLDVGCLGQRPRPPIDPAAIPGGWWSLKTDKAVAEGLDAFDGPYDLVVAARWLSNFAVADLKPVIDRLHRKAAKALLVIENESHPRTVEPGTELRPVGWDRVDWSIALSRKNGIRVVFSMAQPVPDNSRRLASYMTTDGGSDGIWRVVKY